MYDTIHGGTHNITYISLGVDGNGLKSCGFWLRGDVRFRLFGTKSVNKRAEEHYLPTYLPVFPFWIFWFTGNFAKLSNQMFAQRRASRAYTRSRDVPTFSLPSNAIYQLVKIRFSVRAAAVYILDFQTGGCSKFDGTLVKKRKTFQLVHVLRMYITIFTEIDAILIPYIFMQTHLTK